MLGSSLQKQIICASLVLSLFTWVVMPAHSVNVFLASSGDWASYMVDAAWSSVSGQGAPMDLVNINQTVWRLQVVEVSVQYLRLSVTKNLQNGTVVDDYEGSVWTGSGNLSMWFIRENLGVGDSVYEGQELKVNSTSSQDFAGATRSVVYAWFGQSEQQGTVFHEHAFFWDSETGVLCGDLDSYVYYDSLGNVTARATTRSSIGATSLWTAAAGFDFGSYSWWFLGVAVAVLFMSVFVVFYRRMLKARRLRRKSYVRKK